MKPVDAVIPARFASSRLPGKPLLRDTGKYLIQHVWEQVCRARRVRRVIIATDHEEIVQAGRRFGAEVILTSSRHRSGTDRVAEVAERQDLELILDVQGDEPEIDPGALDRLAEALDAGAPMATLAAPIVEPELRADPNAVKVVVGHAGEALYFSRAAVPHGPSAEALAASRLHVGTYAFRREILLQLAALPPSPLEQIEKLEQLRALENGIQIRVIEIASAFAGIDTPQDYRRFVDRYRARIGAGPTAPFAAPGRQSPPTRES